MTMSFTKHYTRKARNLSELKNLLDLTKDYFTKLTFEATVTTGFENIARDECIEKFGKNSSATTSIGRIYFNSKFNNYENFKSLLCVDHVNVIAGFAEVEFGGKPESKTDDLVKIKKTVNVFNWEKVLTVWKEVFDFNGNIFPSRKEYERAINKTDTGKEEESKEVTFQCKNLFYEKADLEKALDSVVDSDEEPEKTYSTELQIPRFRVTCHRVGDNHSFTSMEAACSFGGYLQDKFNWIVDLSHYDLEIILEINNNRIYAGVALNKISNHFRNIKHFGPTTLRATICSNLLRLCDIKPGDIVIDPMCGGGSVVIEGCINYQGGYYLGGDNHIKAINRTKNNINELEKNYKIDAINWDAAYLPLKSDYVDVFVSDLPFGKRCGSKTNNKTLYKKSFNELARVLKVKTGRCIILTSDVNSLKLAYQLTKTFWKIRQYLNINIGGLNACCVMFQRTEEKYYLKLSRKDKKILKKKEWERQQQNS